MQFIVDSDLPKKWSGRVEVSKEEVLTAGDASKGLHQD